MKEKLVALPAKKKLMLLAAGTFLFALVAYSLSIKKTVGLIAEYSAASELSGSNVNAASELNKLQNKLVEMERYFGVADNKPDNFHETLLETVSEFCNENKLVLKSFPEPVVYNSGEFSVETNPVAIKGGFVNMVKLVYELEQKNKVGNVASVAFETVVDPKTKTKSLMLKIYVQNISKIKES